MAHVPSDQMDQEFNMRPGAASRLPLQGRFPVSCAYFCVFMVTAVDEGAWARFKTATKAFVFNTKPVLKSPGLAKDGVAYANLAHCQQSKAQHYVSVLRRPSSYPPASKGGPGSASRLSPAQHKLWDPALSLPFFRLREVTLLRTTSKRPGNVLALAPCAVKSSALYNSSELPPLPRLDAAR